MRSKSSLSQFFGENVSLLKFPKVTLVALAPVLLSVSAVFTLSSSAQAEPACVSPPHGTNGEGAGVMNKTVYLKSAPYSHCGKITSVATGTRLYFHCLTVNDYGNLWWWVRIAGTDTYGWMYDGNIDDISYDDDGDGVVRYASCPY